MRELPDRLCWTWLFHAATAIDRSFSLVPAGLVAGKSYAVKVERTDVNGVTRTGTGKKVAVVAGAPAPVNPPTVTDYEADGMPGEPIYLNDGSIHVNGTNLADATKVLFRYAEDGEPFYEAYPTEVTDTVVDCGSLGYSGEVGSANGYLSVVTPGGESNKLACTFNS